MKIRPLQFILRFTILLIVAACRQQTFSAENIQFQVAVSEQRVGETTLTVKITDNDGNLIENPGLLSLRGDMNHAGMAPVFAEAAESVDGVFAVPFEWTMGGSWILEVSLTLENGEVHRQSFHYEISNEAGQAMPGETSALYLHIANRAAAPVVILDVETAAARQVEFHETTLENDVAVMQKLDSLVIAGGETLELRPGGKHIMLSHLTQDMAPGDQVAFRLILDSGGPIDLTAVVHDMAMGDLEDEVTVGQLVFSQIWLRPASADMGH